MKLKQEKDDSEDKEKITLTKLIEKQLNLPKEGTNLQDIIKKCTIHPQNKIKSKRSLYIDTESVKHRMSNLNVGTKHESHHKYSSNIEACTSRRSILSPCSKSTRATDDELTSRRSMNLYNMIMAQKKKLLTTNSKINETKMLETLFETSKERKLEVKKLPEKINKIKTVYDSKYLLKSTISSPLGSPLRGIKSPKNTMSMYLIPTNRSAVSSNVKNRMNNK